MHASALLPLVLLPSVLCSPVLDALVKRAPATTSSSAAAAASTSTSTTSSVSAIIGLITPACNATCDLFQTDLSACAQLTSTAAIASCACSSQTLGDVRSCASCISLDKNTTSANAVAVVNDYNSFVNLCISEGLASVTGTVSVGQSTTTLDRTLASPTSTIAGATTSAPPKNATYNPSEATTTATAVLSLATGGAVTTGANGTSSAANAGATTTTAAAGAGRTVVGGVMGLVVMLGGAALLL